MTSETRDDPKLGVDRRRSTGLRPQGVNVFHFGKSLGLVARIVGGHADGSREKTALVLLLLERFVLFVKGCRRSGTVLLYARTHTRARALACIYLL